MAGAGPFVMTGAEDCRTVRLKVWFAMGETPLAAVNATVKGDPAAVGGVPLRRPVAESRLAHEGNPVALNVGAGKPVAVTVKLPARPVEKMALWALVMVGATGAADWKARSVPSEPAM